MALVVEADAVRSTSKDFDVPLKESIVAHILRFHAVVDHERCQTQADWSESNIPENTCCNNVM